MGLYDIVSLTQAFVFCASYERNPGHYFEAAIMSIGRSQLAEHRERQLLMYVFVRDFPAAEIIKFPFHQNDSEYWNNLFHKCLASCSMPLPFKIYNDVDYLILIDTAIEYQYGSRNINYFAKMYQNSKFKCISFTFQLR